MKTFTRSFLSILITLLSLTANANPCDDGGIGGTGIPLSRGIGGTGITANGSAGIGGTGISSAHEGIGGTGITNKGIGGTGLEANSGIGGTGIVGVITGFGSVCVNGLEVFYFTDTPVDLDGKKISSESLSIGQVVAVKANGNAHSLIAYEIHAFYQITGPITAIDVPANKIKVMGQPVNANGAQINNMQIGQWVSVSGLRSEDGNVEASRIDPTIERKIASTVGSLRIQGNKIYVGGTKIDVASKIANNTSADTRLTGVWDGNTFSVKDMKPGPVSDLLQKVETFHLQGIAAYNISNSQVKLSGQNVAITAKTKVSGNNASNIQGKPIVVRGQMKDGKATAQSIELRPIKTEVRNLQERQINASQTNSSSESDGKTGTKSAEATDSNKTEHKSKKADKTELSERIAKPERVDKIEKVERVEIPDKIEKVEKVEIPDKIEKVEKRDD
jgi:hypothetical protein